MKMNTTIEWRGIEFKINYVVSSHKIEIAPVTDSKVRADHLLIVTKSSCTAQCN